MSGIRNAINYMREKPLRLILAAFIPFALLTGLFVIKINLPVYIKFEAPHSYSVIASEYIIATPNSSGGYNETIYMLSEEEHIKIVEMLSDTPLRTQANNKNQNKHRILRCYMRDFPSVPRIVEPEWVYLKSVYIYENPKDTYRSFVTAEMLARSGTEWRERTYRMTDADVIKELIFLLDGTEG
jgi:hypothetical protein